MKSKFTITAIAFLMALCPSLTVSAQMNIDDMDEEDWINMRDTSMLSRKNRTIHKENKYNAIQYITNDTYKPDNESFSNSHITDNLYVGASLGMEGIMKEKYVTELTRLTTANIFVGKELTPLHSVRLNLTGAMGHSKGVIPHKYLHFGLKGDYLYNLTNRFRGYNTTRPLEISLLGGVGIGNSYMQKVKKVPEKNSYFNAEAHLGMQFKVYTGPFGSIAIEPYVMVGNDNLDFSEEKNWRGFDWKFGLSAGYMFYTEDHLSKEARTRLLQTRLEGETLIDRQSLASWRTPWFLQMAIGGEKSSVAEGNEASGTGNRTQFAIGRWMSPVIGMRGSFGSRMTSWKMETKTLKGGDKAEANYGSQLMYGKAEFLLNPLGFLPQFSWDANFGGYLFGGISLGEIRHYNYGNINKKNDFFYGYNAGVNIWYRLSNDLQVYVEPHLAHDFFQNYVNEAGQRIKPLTRHDRTTYGVDLGLTMLIRTKRYRDPQEFDELQTYLHRAEGGLSFGLAGGASILQRRGANYGHNGINFNYMAYGEYRFNELHGVRLSADFMKYNAKIPVKNQFMSDINSTLLVASVNYQLNVTNLLSGRFTDRNFQLEAFAGPALSTVVAGTKKKNSNMFVGADFGLKLSVPVAKGISAVLMPTIYALTVRAKDNKPLQSADPVGFGNKVQFFEDINIGLQFDADYFINRINDKINAAKFGINKKWKVRKANAVKRYQEKQRQRFAARRKKY